MPAGRSLAAVALGLALLSGVGSASLGPTSPILLAAEPVDGAKLASPPAKIVLMFSQPLDGAYSRMQVLDPCGNRVDTGEAVVTAGLWLEAPIKAKVAGRYKVLYTANAEPKGATGETTGKLFFNVRKGKDC